MEETQIPWSRLAGFIRKHTHDVRNDLNSLDLESAFLEEIVPPGEMQTGVARIRKQGWAQDRKTKLPAERRSIEAGNIFLRKQGGRWKVHDLYVRKGSCDQVPVKGVAW